MQALLEANLIDGPLPHYTPGALGHALSHKRIWDFCASSGVPVTAAEDDAVFNRHFQMHCTEILGVLPADWDIILWGWNFNSILHVEVLEGLRQSVMYFDSTPLKESAVVFQESRIRSIPLRLLGAFGNVCASISPGGARKLSEGCFPLRDEAVPVFGLQRNVFNIGLDTVMNRYYPALKSYVCFPPLVWTENEKGNSDISGAAQR